MTYILRESLPFEKHPNLCLSDRAALDLFSSPALYTPGHMGPSAADFQQQALLTCSALFLDTSLISAHLKSYQGFPGGAIGKESICQCRRCKRETGSTPDQVDPLEREMAPAPVFLPGIAHGQGSPAGYSPWGHTQSDTTDTAGHRRADNHAYLSSNGISSKRTFLT